MTIISSFLGRWKIVLSLFTFSVHGYKLPSKQKKTLQCFGRIYKINGELRTWGNFGRRHLRVCWTVICFILSLSLRTYFDIDFVMCWIDSAKLGLLFLLTFTFSVDGISSSVACSSFRGDFEESSPKKKRLRLTLIFTK